MKHNMQAEIYGFIKPMVDVHTMGICTMANLLRDCGFKACIAAGTQPDFFVYPGQGHNMRGHQSVHLHERITRYFDDYLK